MRVLAIIAILLAVTAWERAARLAEAGDLEGAEREYRALLAESPEDVLAHYNLGTVLLRQGAYDEARTHLRAAADSASILGGWAAYNLGNTDLEPAAADASLVDRETRLRNAIDAYKNALLLEPEDEDAKWNLELARRLLEEEVEEDPAGDGGGGGGGGGAGAPETGAPDPAPQPGSDGGPQPRMTRAEAEELLDGAQAEELQVQQERLRKPQPPGPIRP